MMRRRNIRRPRVTDTRIPNASGDLHEWVLSLPWVVERPTDGTQPGIRLFAVDCPLLGCRRLWLATGLASADDPALGVAAVMPVAAVRAPHTAGWVVHPATPLPAGHVLVMLQREVTRGRDEIEQFVLSAYAHAMS
jgi:hypothetical protein